MEYEKLYLKTFNEVHSNIENYIKNELIEYINKDYGFNKASNEILEESEKKFETNKFNTTNPYTDLIYIFNNERKKYSKNFNENVFKRDVKPVFDNLQINEYSFEDLIKDLAEYYSETDTYRIFRNENRLFELIYKSEDFSRFEIKEYDTILENTEIFKYYCKLVNPQGNNPMMLNGIETENNQDNKATKKINKQVFDLNEQALILNLCLEDKNSIPLTEKTKLLILIGEINEEKIFNEDSSINNFYKKVNEGCQRRGSISNMIKVIESIIIKTEPYFLNITKQTLNTHKAKLISEEKRTKNT